MPAQRCQSQCPDGGKAAESDGQRHGERSAIVEGTGHRAHQGTQAELCGDGETGGGTGVVGEEVHQAGRAIGAQSACAADKPEQADELLFTRGFIEGIGSIFMKDLITLEVSKRNEKKGIVRLSAK